MQKDAFKPVGREISVMGMANPLMGAPAPQRMLQMPSPPTMGRPQAPAHQQAPVGMPVGRGTPVSDRSGSFKPIGSPLRLAGPSAPTLDGAAVERGASFQPSEPVQIMPGPQSELASAPTMAQAPRPFLQRQSGGETVFRVTMRGRTADGAEYASVYDAVMPPGTEPIALDFAPLT